MCVVSFITLLLSFFTYLDVDAEATTEEKAAPDAPAPETETATEVNEDSVADKENDHIAKVKNDDTFVYWFLLDSFFKITQSVNQSNLRLLSQSRSPGKSQILKQPLLVPSWY